MQQNVKAGLQQLMQKDMDRKDFLKHVGIGFIALTGVATAVKTVSQLNNLPKNSPLGYGASAYGGGPAVQNRKPQGK